MTRWWRRRQRHKTFATIEREVSARRLRRAQRLAAQIEEIRQQNHFADSIVEGLLGDTGNNRHR